MPNVKSKQSVVMWLRGCAFARSVSLHEHIQDSAGGVMEFGISDVKCELMRQAKRVSDGSVGKMVALNDDGSRTVFASHQASQLY